MARHAFFAFAVCFSTVSVLSVPFNKSEDVANDSTRHLTNETVVVVNATAVENSSTSSEKQGRSLEQPQVRFIDPMDILKPVSGLINGDFGTGLIDPKLPFAPKDDGSAAAAAAAAFSPVEPFIAPFRPAAMYYTAASPADIYNLNPQKDLVYPFLDPPKNVLNAIKDKDKDKVKLREGALASNNAARTFPFPGFGFGGFGYGDGFGISPLAIGAGVGYGSFPVNPFVAPFYPFAFPFTGASPADFTGLRPQYDLIYPFLDPPFNVLNAVNKKVRGAGAAEPTPQQVAEVVKTSAAAHQGGPKPDAATTRILGIPEGFGVDGLGFGAPFGDGFGFGAPFGGAFKPFPGEVNLLDKDNLLALSPLTTGAIGGIRPLTDLVYPFLPSDKNPFLSLLYYITPYPLRTQSRMSIADKMITEAVSSRSDLSPMAAVMHARSLQNLVAAAELHHTLKSLGLGDVSAELINGFMPEMVSRQAVIPTLNALGLNPFEDLFNDLFDGGKENEKLGKIPGAAAILHYFYPHLPKRVLKPFKPVVDLRALGIDLDSFGIDFDGFDFNGLFGGKKDDNEKLGKIPGAAAILHYFYPNLPKKVLKPFKPVVDLRLATAALSDAVSQRLFEIKYAAAVAAMKKDRFQQRLMDQMSGLGRHARQADDDGTDVDGEGESEELFAGQAKNPLAQVFRFFVPEMGISDPELENAGDENKMEDLLENREINGTDGLSAATGAIADAVEEHAPFPLNHIFNFWRRKRSLPSSRKGRSLEEAHASFNSSLQNLRKIQHRSMSLNDSFVEEIRNSTNSSVAGRQGRQLGGLVGALLPFPFNLLAAFLPARDGNPSEAEVEEQDVADLDPATLDDEFEENFKAAGITAQEGDRRMASMIGPFLPEPLNAMVGAVFPFRSFEQDIEQESNMEDNNSASEHDEALKRFQESLEAMREQYGKAQPAQDNQGLAAQAMSSV